MADKKYPIWGNRLENNTIQMNNSEFTMNSIGATSDNLIRNNIFDLINSSIKQSSYGFSCKNLMENNKFKLRGSTIEQSCVIIMKERGMKKPQIRTIKRIIRGK